MTEPQLKDLIEKMCMNEYRSKIERSVKLEIVGTPKVMLPFDTNIALLVQIELLNKKLDEGILGRANVSQVQTLRCDLCGEEHANERCSLEGTSEKVQFANVQKNNLFEEVTRNHDILSRNHDTSIKNLETQIDRLSRKTATLPSSSGGFTGNTVNNPKNETCKVVETDFGVVTRKEEAEKVIPSNRTLTLADSSVTRPLGIVQDVLVHVDGLTFPAEFVVIDMKNDSEGSMILGRPFLATGKDLETCYQLKEKGSEVHTRIKKGVFTGVRVSFAPDVF
ncbi:hypothetical protein KIW84_077105 [Lathyrus oleraceus]|uniref:Uncharacterized protein n=1 Tax=Pisum sativum TaxID=3888 RepID=A0A9D4VYA1_PEA|nr:hypothetical protein KIW84_077105 [Pisum sativum]